jgi:hypothetical protein
MVKTPQDTRHVRLVTEKTVEHFLQRLFLRDMPVRSLCLVSPFINTMEDSRFTLADLSAKIARERIPTYVVNAHPPNCLLLDLETTQQGRSAVKNTFISLGVPCCQPVRPLDMVARRWRRVKRERMQRERMPDNSESWHLAIAAACQGLSIPVARQAIGLNVSGSNRMAPGGPRNARLKCQIVREIVRTLGERSSTSIPRITQATKQTVAPRKSQDLAETGAISDHPGGWLRVGPVSRRTGAGAALP